MCLFHTLWLLRMSKGGRKASGAGTGNSAGWRGGDQGLDEWQLPRSP